LIEAAEQLAEQEGVAALSVRRLADEVGTTTRAVYSVFGSKEGLLVALGRRAFDLLAAAMDQAPLTDDPAADLAASGVDVFRHFVTQHPSLFQIGVQNTSVSPELAGEFRAAADSALARLEYRVSRLSERGGLGARSVRDAVCEFHALCEGLAALEFRGVLPRGDEERIWRDALSALVAGFGRG
jgi:AcrR family transcriptional regulator